MEEKLVEVFIMGGRLVRVETGGRGGLAPRVVTCRLVSARTGCSAGGDRYSLFSVKSK